jgi:cell shape-determining protein MreC
MRLVFLFLIFLVSCNSPELNVQNDEPQAVDSILEQSQRSFVTADSANKQSDELINRKVTKTVKQITTLKEEVKTLKEENNELKTKLDDAVDAGKPFQLLPVSNGKDNR